MKPPLASKAQNGENAPPKIVLNLMLIAQLKIPINFTSTWLGQLQALQLLGQGGLSAAARFEGWERRVGSSESPRFLNTQLISFRIFYG